ncbi:MAG: T9SS type A sorting domain-containing protein [Saprospiraceae bacterium]|uniref:T9SS type A sorting domain-containing protein n=1 Tax=Candidatus Defluviibacterium haderslevense TaxID=2981993 RepID=A0A9D7XFH6_9BACT|nr:T9SS type A sorting domain-containing protein [Candidatus Defluviibacterium haderslevense]
MLNGIQKFSYKNKGTNKVTLTAIDCNGNSSTGTAIVNVLDTESPKITCPLDISVTTKPGQFTVMSSIVPLGSPTCITDNFNVKYPVTKNSVTIYPFGVTNIYWTILDSSLNSSSCTQKITILATTCGTPVKVNNGDSTNTSTKIKWKPATCATEYQVSYREELTQGVWGGWSAWTNANDPTLLYLFTGFKAKKYYNYQIRAKCAKTFSASVLGNIQTKAGASLNDIQNRNSDDSDNSIVLPTRIQIIPNPARDNTTLLIQGFENHSKEVTMLDCNGKLIFKVNVFAIENQLELNLKTLFVMTGIYLIRVADNNKRKTEQLVIGK